MRNAMWLMSELEALLFAGTIVTLVLPAHAGRVCWALRERSLARSGSVATIICTHGRG
jgi:hypothetical protein